MSHALFDALKVLTGSKTDAVLSELLEISPSHVSACRTSRESIGADYILRIYDKTGMSIERIRELIKSDAPKAPSGRQITRMKKAARDDLLSQIVARPKRAQRKSGEDNPRAKRLTVTKAAQWTSTVHRLM
jgi:hypothetical protein